MKRLKVGDRVIGKRYLLYDLIGAEGTIMEIEYRDYFPCLVLFDSLPSPKLRWCPMRYLDKLEKIDYNNLTEIEE